MSVVANLTTVGTKLVYSKDDVKVTWNVGKTGPGKAKITSDATDAAREYAQKAIDAYVKGWANDRMSAVYEFCHYANEKGVMEAARFLS